MGKKSKKEKTVSASGKPFVSVCTPTYNRRLFIPFLIRAFEKQTYPRHLMEWIIIDDGTDPVEDLFKDVSGVKYFYYSEKMPIGKKRNIMHQKAKGEIIVYMDDDDYYPPERINHAVNRLRSNHRVMCSGSSRLLLYFKHLQKIYEFGPYGPNHATAGTFAFKRELLNDTRYDDDAELAEEKRFLQNYTVPFIQLDPTKTILVASHDYNTFDKRRLLDNPHPDLVRETKFKLKDIIKDKVHLEFFKNI